MLFRSSFDMGGTSIDIGVIIDAEVPTRTESWAGDERVGIKMVDVHSAGAGGGSIAWIDDAGRLHVGPRSAGSDPGPVAFGRGGTEPTVTDANLVLGRLNPDYFNGGRMALDADAASRVVGTLAAAMGDGFRGILTARTMMCMTSYIAFW